MYHCRFERVDCTARQVKSKGQGYRVRGMNEKALHGTLPTPLAPHRPYRLPFFSRRVALLSRILPPALVADQHQVHDSKQSPFVKDGDAALN